MGTLLAFNETIALIGDSDGSIHTEPLPTVKSEAELERYFYNKYKEAGHTSKDAEYIEATRVGALRPTDDLNVNILETSVERIPIKTYTDEASGLSVRAAFDLKTRLWVVAHLKSNVSDSE